MFIVGNKISFKQFILSESTPFPLWNRNLDGERVVDSRAKEVVTKSNRTIGEIDSRPARNLRQFLIRDLCSAQVEVIAELEAGSRTQEQQEESKTNHWRRGAKADGSINPASAPSFFSFSRERKFFRHTR